jgi:hypothetical protein
MVIGMARHFCLEGFQLWHEPTQPGVVDRDCMRLVIIPGVAMSSAYVLGNATPSICGRSEQWGALEAADRSARRRHFSANYVARQKLH